jgi:hypothetical protein
MVATLQHVQPRVGKTAQQAAAGGKRHDLIAPAPDEQGWLRYRAIARAQAVRIGVEDRARRRDEGVAAAQIIVGRRAA